jgi:hypothetical protein
MEMVETLNFYTQVDLENNISVGGEHLCPNFINYCVEITKRTY